MGRGDKIQWSDACMVLALLVLGILLCFLGTGLLSQWHESMARHQGESVDLLLGGTTAATGIGLLLWWGVSILTAGASVLLERLGRRRAAAAARRLSPAFMRRAVVAALSIQLASGVAAHAAVLSAPGPEWTPTQAHVASSAPSDPAAPQDGPLPRVSDSPGGVRVKNPPLPVAAAPAGQEGPSPATNSIAPPTVTPIDPGWQPAPPVVEPGLLAAPETRTAAEWDGSGPGANGRGGPVKAVTVLAGDTLWDIVATHLGPEASDVDIALEWPRWYAANRALIGGSPDVLLPGQILQAPAAS